MLFSLITEAPEPEYDPRSLFDRLQEQKILKQEEFEESRRLKNLICVLDSDETAFLEMVDKNKMDEEIAKLREERAAVEEFRKAIEGLTKDEQESKISEFKSTFSLKCLSRKSTKRTLNGSLANLIKIKKTPSHESKENPSSSTPENVNCPPVEKDEKVKGESASKHQEINESKTNSSKESADKLMKIESKVNQPIMKTCLVDYGSDSEDESDEDETINPPIKKSKTTE